MKLVLTEDQRALQGAARTFAQQQSPVTALRALRDSKNVDGFDRGVWREMAALGWTGIVVAEDHGGLGFGYVGAGLVAEELGRTLAASPFLSTAVVAATALAGSTSPWLAKIAAGDAIVALAIDEGRVHDPAAVAPSRRARR